MGFIKHVIGIACLILYASAASTPCSNCDGNNVTCVDGVCLPRCVNVTSSGECLQCRDSRFYRKQCEHDCPDNCLNSRCQMDNTRVVCTEGCVAGRKGDNCGVTCPTACTQCERYGDGCTGPCQNPRYYGPHCRTPCSSSCTDGCNRTTGECGSCEPGYMGDKCNVTCPPSCRDGCDKDTGECGSCEPGYTGDKCDVTCPPNCRDGCDKDTGECVSCVSGYRGKNCNDACPPNCRDGCDKDTGECDSCVSGYRGKNCNDSCPSNCSDGCDKEIGKCESCNPGNSGKYCNISCPITCSEVCNQDGGCILTVKTTVVVAVLVMAALILLLIIILMYTRRFKRRQLLPKRIFPGTSNPTYTSCADSMLHVDVCEELSGDKWIEYMLEEFKKLPSPGIKPTYCASLEENTEKNRYKDVLPFDATRVPLVIEEEDDSDYINASYVDGYREQTRYVAAQGPSEETADDFWRMIWQLNTTKIVMVTNLVEAGKVKCERYWPFCSSESTMYGRMSVQCVEEKVYQTYTLRSLAIWKEGAQTRVINQFHFTKWPDHGVPEDTTALLHFYRAVKDTGPDFTGPLVIHCSAGVGRSGTFLALDYLLDQARSEGRVCVYNCVQHFRRKRMKMVQTKEQYVFIYSILNAALRSLEILPRAKKPIRVQCEKCWFKVNAEMSDGDRDVDEEDEYHLLWTCKLEDRQKLIPGGPTPLPDVITVVSETLPLLERGADHPDEERLSPKNTDNKEGRISWVTAL
ncbi:receptor-type tyrosine-protein phosphatase H-like isoform X2 [Haliotis rufescens]|uniref:receptor-type tyrosine-protein phosphatase H-like isoform X2 n=1 Tax=Haliotis rufescens TaxID=6454 RepID=UPI00201ED0B5|nr:receptor-type tyrosine-protein phosphatase H-like isoform X2 [Haliotis rufescens]